MADNETRTLRPAVEGLFHAAVAVLGLGVVVYTVGAVTFWVRLSKSTWPVDIAVEHQPRSALTDLGMRGALEVVVPFTLVVLLVLAARPRLRRFMPNRTWWSWLLVMLIALSLVVGLSFVSWSWFGFAILLAAFLLVTHWYLGVAAPTLMQSYALVILCLLAALAAAVAVQIGGTIHVQAVRLSRVPPELARQSLRPKLLTNAPFPYFGETASFVYVGRIRSILQAGPGRYLFNFCHEREEIVEVPRSEVTLTFLSNPDTLYSDNEAPGLRVWHRLFGGPRSTAPAQKVEGKHQTAEEKRLAAEKGRECRIGRG